MGIRGGIMVNDNSPFEIRLASPCEWEKVMVFVWGAFMLSEGRKCADEGRDSFFRFITDHELRESFLSGEYPVLVAHIGDEIVGVAAIRYRNHLSLLFVDREHQRQGLGKALMTAVIESVRDAGERYMSVQAVSDAVNFYRKMGFHSVRPEREFSGIRVTDMERFF